MSKATHTNDDQTGTEQAIAVLDDLHKGDKVEITPAGHDVTVTWDVRERTTDDRHGEKYDAVVLRSANPDKVYNWVLVQVESGKAYGYSPDHGMSEGYLGESKTAEKVETGPQNDDFYDRNNQLDRGELLRVTRYNQLCDEKPSWTPETDELSFEKDNLPGDWEMWGCNSSGQHIYFQLGTRGGIHVHVGYVGSKDAWFADIDAGHAPASRFCQLFDSQKDAERFAYGLMANAGHILENAVSEERMADYDWWQA